MNNTQDIKFAKKITIFGMPGSGKTTLGKKLSKDLSLPLHHLDKLLWDKGWKLRDKKAFLKDHNAIIKKKKWIVEGTCISTLKDRYPKSDLVIFLKPPKVLCLYRVVLRALLNKKQPSDKPAECKERVDWEFIKYLWKFNKAAIPLIEQLQKKYPKIKLQTYGLV